MMSDKQTIRAGTDSTNIQGREVTVHQHQHNGLSYVDAREIALDVFRNNFYELSGEAANLANQRVEEFTDKLIERMKCESESLLNSMKDPDMQYALYTAQREYARTGDKDLSEMLQEILVDRAEITERSLIQIVLNESLEVLPKLTQTQLDILSLVFIIRYTRQTNINNLDEFKLYLSEYVIPLIENVPTGTPHYQHLEYTGCASISVLDAKIEDLFVSNYPGLFMKGFTKEEFNQVIGEVVLNHSVLIPSLHDNELYQINALNDEVIEDRCKSAGASEILCQKLKNLQSSKTLSSEEIKEYLSTINPVIEKMFITWQSTSLCVLTLSSVGIALGRANLQRKLKKEFDLSIWIN